MNDWSPQQKAEEESNLVHYLINHVTGKTSGRTDDVCLYDMPHDRYFLGNLRSTEGKMDKRDTLLERELMNKIAPVAFGAEFLLSPSTDKIQLKIMLNWACYYRVFPSFEEQTKHVQYEPYNNNIEDSQTNDEIMNDEEINDSKSNCYEKTKKNTKGRHQNKQSDTLCPKFKKISCKAESVVDIIGNQEHMRVDDSELIKACSTEMSRAKLIVLNDPEAIKTSADIDGLLKIPDSILETSINYQSYLRDFKTSILPEWSWNIVSKLESSIQGNVLSIIFENISPMPTKSFNRESYLFDVRADFEFFQKVVIPFELELAPQGFRYDRMMWGRGFNCEVTKENENIYHTTHNPLYIQKRYDTNNQPEARFDALSKDPIPVLNNILNSMKSYLGEWDSAEVTYELKYNSEWLKFKTEFKKDRSMFESEINRFTKGLKLIESDPDVTLAFMLTNETFLRMGIHPTKPKVNWRLFQIAFLVNQIPGMASLKTQDITGLEDREMVDIIYFPTGGGKTEAYLGALIFHCFFDRLRGKAAGVTAWLRFPLRLLTLQQTQRVVDAIGMAEIIRCEQTDSRLSSNVDGFSVGYFVGESSSPNILTPNSTKAEDIVNWSKAKDPIEREKWKRVVSCPVCHTPTVRVDLDEDHTRIIHRCTNPNCLFPNGRIPLFIVDNEIYRYLPSVIVGTIDKLAGLGNQRNFSLILGKVTGFCPTHGYFNAKCCHKGCKDEKKWQKGIIPKGLSGPTLFIQDELHLLREGLGTFDGHYETFVQELLKEFKQEGPLKIIASSATIEAFERQVEHLYGRQRTQARVFPGFGPSLEKSFYAQTRDYPQRLFLGIIPHNKTIFNTILELLEIIHSKIQLLGGLPDTSMNPYGGKLQPGSTNWKLLMDLYLTSLTYFLANRDLSSIKTDVETHVNSNLEQNGLNSINLAELTGNTATAEVANILDKVDKTYQTGYPNGILANVMISHGVDVDRFNMMIYYGMPRQNAEYIQSSSRVGRSHVGLVIMCFHPVRERDQSHYNYFIKYHQFLGQMVEPVAINRWSKFSVDRTLPGLFMAVLLQILANNPGNSDPGQYYLLDTIKKKISTHEITQEQFIPILKKAYCVNNPSSISEQYFNDEIELRVKQFFDQIIGAGSHSPFVSNALYPQPMRSLRDVDESIEIELDDIGSTWALR